MRAPISIIIPTLNAAQHLPACLHSLGEGLQAGLIRELVISDGGSDDATLKLAEAAGAHVVTGPPSRAGQVRHGCDAAEGDWLLILPAHTRLAEGWSSTVTPVLTRPGAYHFRLALDATGVMPACVAGWANLRARVFGLPRAEQGLLIDRATLKAAGGFADRPTSNDAALVRRPGRLQCLPATVIASARA
ncbi:glycosyltransferase [Antarctobacter jejuensis]|uniref:glycosyltransferase n=1 Tax=Antarctobacter jejuensis TaxID=1439938 RepID=UPI003FD59D79